MVMPVIMFPSNFISSFSNLLIPEFSEFYAKKSYSKMNSAINQILNIVSIFSILVAIFCFIFSDKISLIVYGNLECAIYIRLLSPLIFFIYLDNIIDSILKGLDKQFGVMICNILDLFISITLIYFKEMGISPILCKLRACKNFCVNKILLMVK